MLCEQGGRAGGLSRLDAGNERTPPASVASLTPRASTDTLALSHRHRCFSLVQAHANVELHIYCITHTLANTSNDTTDYDIPVTTHERPAGKAVVGRGA